MLFTYTTGELGASAIVFLHGGGLSGRMWQPQMERLSDYYCLAPDLPEQGKSLASGPFHLEDAARRVIELIHEQISGQRAHLVGLSLGADVALAIMKIAPEVVDHVVISGAAPLGKVLGKSILACLALLPFSLLNTPRQLDRAAKQFGIPAVYHAMFREDLLLSTTRAFTRHSIEALMDLTHLLPSEANIPVLVTVGAQENSLAKGGARKVAASLRQAQLVVVPQVGHVWSLQASDLFTDAVRAWIEDCPLPEALRS